MIMDFSAENYNENLADTSVAAPTHSLIVVEFGVKTNRALQEE